MEVASLCIPEPQTVDCGDSNAKIMGSVPSKLNMHGLIKMCAFNAITFLWINWDPKFIKVTKYQEKCHRLTNISINSKMKMGQIDPQHNEIA